MSITLETAKAHAKDPAVLCCRFEAGNIIEVSNLEDPAIFPDLVESGLLQIGEDTLTIEEVLGAKLTQTVDALTPLTREMLSGIASPAEEKRSEAPMMETVSSVASVEPVATIAQNTGMIRIHIGEGRDINLEIPLSVARAGMAENMFSGSSNAAAPVGAASEQASVQNQKTLSERVIRSLKRRHFQIDEVRS